MTLIKFNVEPLNHAIECLALSTDDPWRYRLSDAADECAALTAEIARVAHADDVAGLVYHASQVALALVHLSLAHETKRARRITGIMRMVDAVQWESKS